MTQRKDERKDTVVATTAIVKYRFISRAGGQGAIAGGNAAANTPAAPLGVALYDGKVGDQIAVVCDGTVQVECTGAIVAGSGVIVQPDGRISNAGGTGGYFMYSKTSTTAAGQLCEVDINKVL
jgi:hypothetical protein